MRRARCDDGDPKCSPPSPAAGDELISHPNAWPAPPAPPARPMLCGRRRCAAAVARHAAARPDWLRLRRAQRAAAAAASRQQLPLVRLQPLRQLLLHVALHAPAAVAAAHWRHHNELLDVALAHAAAAAAGAGAAARHVLLLVHLKHVVLVVHLVVGLQPGPRGRSRGGPAPAPAPTAAPVAFAAAERRREAAARRRPPSWRRRRRAGDWQHVVRRVALRQRQHPLFPVCARTHKRAVGRQLQQGRVAHRGRDKQQVRSKHAHTVEVGDDCERDPARVVHLRMCGP
eukprot:32664-Chlamydomonas_euryale.AAC.5